jgi:SPASM domain peptide maturase of grasp-with-spasm system
MNEYFKLFSCCKIVKGFKRSIIYDLQREEYHLIPNSLYEILLLHKEKSILEIKQMYDEESRTFIDNYFQYLFDKEITFLCKQEDLSMFPDINFDWKTPCLIENFILDVNETSSHDFSKIVESLSLLTLKVVQLHFFYTVNLHVLKEILLLIKESNIRSVELIIPFQS